MIPSDSSATQARCQRKRPSHCDWPFIQWSRSGGEQIYIFFLLYLQAEGEDNLKKMQLMELAILNGTYRDNNIKARE